MRKTVGILMIAVSLYVFFSQAWYLNFEMEAWSRGMEKTPTYQRILATLILAMVLGGVSIIGWRITKNSTKSKNEKLRERYPSPFIK
jgi:hypothetical protein